MAKQDLLKKGLLIGVGAAAYAQEKTEQLAKELIRRGHINKAEGKKMVRKIYGEAERNTRKISRLAEQEIKKILNAAEAKGAKRMGLKGAKKKRR